MTTPYRSPIGRDPAEVLEETRQEVADRIAKKKKKRDSFILDLKVFVLIGSLLLGATLLVGWIIYGFRNMIVEDSERREREAIAVKKAKQDRISGDCSLFAAEKMTDIPVRCIRFFNEGDGGK